MGKRWRVPESNSSSRKWCIDSEGQLSSAGQYNRIESRLKKQQCFILLLKNDIFLFYCKVQQGTQKLDKPPQVSAPSAYPWKHRALLEMRGPFHAQLQQQH